MRNGIDISTYQDPAKLDYAAARAAGDCDFAMVRATFGCSGVDKHAAKHGEGVRECGADLGYFSFAHPSKTRAGGARGQAEHFVNTVLTLPSDTIRPALDLEDGAKALSPVELTDWAVAWMRIVGAGLGVDPILYCTLDYLRHHLVDRRGLDHHGLWLAVRQPIEVITPAWLERKLRGLPCTRVEMVQWCSDGRITGYGKKIDRDLMVL